jgi:hypothetical protein
MADFLVGDFSFEFDSVVRGHHIYKSFWTPLIGETLSLMTEDANAHDSQAVAVMKGGSIVGHAPRGLARVFFFFIEHGGSISCEITGHRKYGCGLEVPCCYKLTGKPKYVRRAKELLKKNNSTV